ncbi:hypothetical protein QVD17_07720 [Tagetes erecta]|uniref:Uncharacterized protein n=1 Tax=Tagetes erecta TaxID=13708 RepID=A0AAD8LNW1_TARER|nr:hypothetical protein QVD17_07720 [Tagetes erecta]
MLLEKKLLHRSGHVIQPITNGAFSSFIVKRHQIPLGYLILKVDNSDIAASRGHSYQKPSPEGLGDQIKRVPSTCCPADLTDVLRSVMHMQQLDLMAIDQTFGSYNSTIQLLHVWKFEIGD